jgi:succinate-semialdehyde dehydrogenase/glutarate-semialdehyde dehydrogenase
MSIASVNPATGAVLQTFVPISQDEINQKLATSEETFQKYRKTSFSDRSKWMFNTAEILDSENEGLGKLMAMEMGKPLKAAKEEAAKCAWVCRFYAENAERFLSDEAVQTNASHSYVHYQPLGPILAVMPWNFPFWQVFRFAAPALMAGNVALLKHASNVPQCALSIEDVIRRSGFPQGAFLTLLIGSNQVKHVLEDPRIKAATLTGSKPAGSDVASIAGKNIKKTVLELGGSDPFIIMSSADLEDAVKTAVKARCINNGQSCIAAKRFIVHQKIADEFEQRFVKGMEELTVGDPMDEETDVGPLATAQLLEQLDQQVQKTVSAGARVLTGGKKLNRPGNYYTPTVLTDIPKNSPAYHEEVFGPVALLFRIQNIDEAISLANDTTFGLGSAAWTNDKGEKQQFIDGIEAGAVFINGMVASDPRLPFGGVKHSGYGRELGVFGIREFVNIKTVWVK